MEKFAECLFFAAALSGALATLSVLGFMLKMALPLFREGRFFELLGGAWAPGRGEYGIFPMIAGTLSVGLSGVALAFPLSLGCSSLICVIAPPGFARFLRGAVRLMTGIPTVIYGFVGVFLLVPHVREIFQEGSGMCVLSAALMLAMVVSPTMILFFTDAFDGVPLSHLRAADALGATKVQKLLHVIIPCARRGILTGLVLGTGRALGDTLISLMLAGNAVRVPGSLLESARTLTAHIALVIAADCESPEFLSVFACGIVLYGMTTLGVLLLRAKDVGGEKGS